MNKLHVLINDLLLPADDAFISINDLSIQRGYGIFDFFKTINGKPVFLDDHLDRFYYSAKQMRLPLKKSRHEIKDLIFNLIAENNIPDSGIRMTLTGGYSNDGFNIADPNLIISQQIFALNTDIISKGIRLITHSYQRRFSDAKTIDYMEAIWLQPLIRERNADDVLYQNNGIITECPRANFFIVNADGHVLTPFKNILQGISRKHILGVSAKLFLTKESNITLNDIKHAKEAFITSTTKNIVPVVQIDGSIIGDGKPGRITQALINDYNRIIYG